MPVQPPRLVRSLAQEHTRWLALAFLAVELLVAVLVTVWVLLPLARRSADDLAGLMVLSAQTWAELPPQTRHAFEEELSRSHALALRADRPAQARDEFNTPYFYLLESALSQRTGQPLTLLSEHLPGQTWYWAPIPTGSSVLLVGVPATRIQSQPLLALGLALLGALGGAMLLAAALARRLTRPLAQLEAASALIGQGGQPSALPETGPREVVALSQRFNAMAQQVRDLLSARTTLLAGVSHDLRTPLARMCLALEMLKTQPSPALIERMERDIAQMNQLIGHVLELARGLAHEPPKQLDLDGLLHQIAADFSTPERPIDVNCPPLEWTVAPSALQRAIGNLLQNALRYAPDGPVTLVAEVDATHCRIGVLDRGPGVPTDQLEAVFQPFHRLDSSRSPATGGSGLGLTIVKELAQANGWQVSLQARPGGGLAAWIALPLVNASGL